MQSELFKIVFDPKEVMGVGGGLACGKLVPHLARQRSPAALSHTISSFSFLG